MYSPKIKVEIQAILTDQDSRVIKRYPWKRANSLLKQFILLLTIQLSQVAQIVKNIAGAERSLGISASNFRNNTAINVTTHGIIIGTGTTPVTMTDWKLQTQVTTNIAHAAVTHAVENPDTTTWRVAISRGFTNNTGAVLNVTEVGLASQDGDGTYDLLDRTLYAVAVPSGTTLTLTYRITISL